VERLDVQTAKHSSTNPELACRDEFLAGSDLRTFKVVVVSEDDPPPEMSGVARR
jgi:hypothetical protein